MSARTVKQRDRVRLYAGPPEPRQSIITPQLRQALADKMEEDPERFLKLCAQVRVISLRQIPAWIDLAISCSPRDRDRAAQIARLALQHGIDYKH